MSLWAVKKMFSRFRRLLVRLLTSSDCKGIICHVEIGKMAFVHAMGSPQLEEKIRVIYPAVSAKTFLKEHRTGERVRLLFVSSVNINTEWQFLHKGGLVLLAAFQELRNRFDNLELVVRSRVPAEVRAKFGRVSDIRLIEDPLPWEEMDILFKSADIFVCPAHLTPSLTFLDAMNYELPIVTTDVWSNPELVENGWVGLLVHHPEAHRYIVDSIVHHDWFSFRQVVSRVHPDLVAGQVKNVGVLVENPDLRRRMGREGRREVEQGRFWWRPRKWCSL